RDDDRLVRLEARASRKLEGDLAREAPAAEIDARRIEMMDLDELELLVSRMVGDLREGEPRGRKDGRRRDQPEGEGDTEDELGEEAYAHRRLTQIVGTLGAPNARRLRAGATVLPFFGVGDEDARRALRKLRAPL